MVDELLKIWLTISLILTTFCSLGQTPVEINPPKLSFEKECLHIYYNLSDKGNNHYNIHVEIVNSTGYKIKANAFSGDWGTNIKAGKNKYIIWDLSKDNVLLNESISVKIVAELMPKKISKTNLLLKSTIWPGWGHTKFYEGKPYWLIGFAGAACLAGSYVYNQQSANSYDKYVSAITSNDSEKYYDQAIQQDNTSKILAYTAIGIWAANIIWVAILPTKSKFRTSSNKVSLYLLPVNVGGNNTVASFGLNLKF